MPRRIVHLPSKDEDVIQYTLTAATMLREISDAANAPCFRAVAGLSLLILNSGIRTNKIQCLRLIERVHNIVCAVITVCADTKVELSLQMERSITQFCETLEKIQSFVRNQGEIGRIKRFVRHLENKSQLEECNAGLDRAIELFGVQVSMITVGIISTAQKEAVKRHNEIMEVLMNRNHSSNCSVFSSSSDGLSRRSSSNSVLLPASPKICHGREREIDMVTSVLLREDPSRVAILGPGGIGKSTLATSVLHHPDIVSMFGKNRHFLTCEAAKTPSELAALFAAYFGLKNEGNTIKNIVRHVSNIMAPLVMVLDNLDSCWEPLESRNQVEEFLSLLTDVPTFNLIVTLRGAERPSQVRWCRPFLPPLEPLSDVAARETFEAIVDHIDDQNQLTELLLFTDKVPLAVHLVAHLVALEGFSAVIDRWKAEKTGILSKGSDRRSSLERSIVISLSSPRFSAHPDAQQLLRLLSILPDGLSDMAMKETQFPFSNVRRCRTTLLRTSLAYVAQDGRLKVLAPIREYIRTALSPTKTLIRPLQKYLFDVVKLSEHFYKSPSDGIIKRISGDLGNIRSLLRLTLVDEGPDLKDAIDCVLQLARFSRHTNLGTFDLLRTISPLVEALDQDIRGQYLLVLASSGQESPSHRDSLLRRAIREFDISQNWAGQASAYVILAHINMMTGNMKTALECCFTSISLAKKTGDLSQESYAMQRLADVHRHRGEFGLSLVAANESQFMARAAGNLLREADSLFTGGRMYVELGHYRAASSMFQKAQELCSALGLDSDSRLPRNLMHMQAEVHLRKTEYEDARHINTLILGLGQELEGLSPAEPYALLNVAIIDISTGKGTDQGVHQKLVAARQIFSAEGNLYGVAFCDITFGDLHLSLGQTEEARILYCQNLASTRGSFSAPALTCLAGLSNIGRLTVLRTEICLRFAVPYLVFARKTQDRKAMQEALTHIGDAVGNDDDETALALFTAALDGFTEMDIHQGRADCMLRIGDILIKQGEAVVEAQKMWAAARPLFSRASQSRGVSECDHRLTELRPCSSIL